MANKRQKVMKSIRLSLYALIPSCPPYVGRSRRFSQATCDTNSCTTTTQIKITSQMQNVA